MTSTGGGLSAATFFCVPAAPGLLDVMPRLESTDLEKQKRLTINSGG